MGKKNKSASPLAVRSMKGLGHILEDRARAFDSNELGTCGRATLERNGRLAATEVARNKREKLFVRVAVDGRRPKLSKPYAIFRLRQGADARVRLDLDRDDGDLSFLKRAHGA